MSFVATNPVNYLVTFFRFLGLQRVAIRATTMATTTITATTMIKMIHQMEPQVEVLV